VIPVRMFGLPVDTFSASWGASVMYKSNLFVCYFFWWGLHIPLHNPPRNNTRHTYFYWSDDRKNK
jgi:hypothetical protein